MRKSIWALAALAVAGAGAFVVPMPAVATTTGVTELTCITTLPHWPTTQTITNQTCTGFTPGVNGGGAGLTTSNNPYVIAAAKGSATSNFSYSEPCPVPGAKIPPLVGFANGTITATGLKAVVKTAKTSAKVVEGFSWTRVGVTAVVTTGPETITFGNGQTATAAAPGAAVGAFAALTNPKTNTCPLGGPLTARVASVGAGAA